jgi:hypothetical protein
MINRGINKRNLERERCVCVYKIAGSESEERRNGERREESG